MTSSRNPIPLLRAFKVTETCEDTGGIVFAKSNAQARREGASIFADGDWYGVECRRAPEFDRFSPGPVPESAMMDAGWYQWCKCGCERKISGGYVEDQERDEEREAWVDKRDGSVWCSRWAPMNLAEFHARQRWERKMALYLARQALPADAEVVDDPSLFHRPARRYDYVDVYGPPALRRVSNLWGTSEPYWPGPHRGQARVRVFFWSASFRFPGAQYLSEWRSNEGTAFVPGGDLYAYYVWRGMDPDAAALEVAKRGFALPVERLAA